MLYTELIDSVVGERKLATVFSPAEIAEAEKAAALPRNCHNRSDCREQELVTIDDETAADFDDAVGCRQLPSGAIVLSVAIADVIAYIPAQSVLDTVALSRGNSVYLPDRTLPMLPAALSGQACSLLPNEERLCLVCEMEVKDGVVHQYRFFRALIRSSARLTYNEAAVLMESADGPYPTLPLLAELSDMFRTQRASRGAMILELPEKACLIDEQGELQTVTKERNIAHWAIEEAMIAANRCAADFIIRHKRFALYRMHPSPPTENLRRLSAILSALGIPFPQAPQAADFAKTLMLARQRDEALGEVLIPAVLGALSRAEYGPNAEVGHFGLSCPRYLHFTSPIRRYPDLLTHRALVAILEGAPSPFENAALVEIGAHCSATEVSADKAGWDCRQRLLCLPAQQFINCEYEGTVSGLTNNGFFVSAKELNVDGFVRFSSMPGYWRYDEAGQRLTCDDKIISFGDKIAVRLKAVNPWKGRVDFTFLKGME